MAAIEVYMPRSMGDVDGPIVARSIYQALFHGEDDVFNPDVVPYALDDAIQRLRKQNVSSSRWATYVHLGL